ncbi:MAG TPA: helix-turn-helix domain-containing protein [Candidatus Saccharimonadales bacterium]
MSRPQRVTNEAIYEAAHEIIMQHGPASLTFQTLGKATGLVPAALVRRFKSKQQLFIEVDTYCLEKAANTLAEAAKRFDSALDAIVYGLSGEMGFAMSANVYVNGLAFLLKGLDTPELYKNYQAAFRRQEDDIRQLLEKAVTQMELRQNVDCVGLAKLLQITQQGACHMWIMSQEEPIEKCIERHLRTLLEAYKNPSRGLVSHDAK